jgi:hypothetical protein
MLITPRLKPHLENASLEVDETLAVPCYLSHESAQLEHGESLQLTWCQNDLIQRPP